MCSMGAVWVHVLGNVLDTYHAFPKSNSIEEFARLNRMLRCGRLAQGLILKSKKIFKKRYHDCGLR